MLFKCFVLLKKWFIHYLLIGFSNVLFCAANKNKLSLFLSFLLLIFNISVFANDLFSAVKNRDAVAISKLIKAGHTVNCKNVYGKTPLHEAIEDNFTEGAILLIVSDFNTRIRDRYDRTVFHAAALKGNLEVLTHLIPFIHNLNIEDSHGNTALHIAVSKGYTSIVNLLLKYNKYADNSFKAATNINCNRSIILAKNKNININLTNYNGNTPLHLAARDGRYECLLQLLGAQGIDTAVINKGGFSVLSYALKNKWINCIKLLLAFSSGQPDILNQTQDQSGSTLLHQAIFTEEPEILHLLIDNAPSISVNIQNNKGRTVLWYAAINGNEVVIDALLKVTYIDVNIGDHEFISPLMVAVMNGRYNCVKKLLEAGANPNISNIHGSQALHFAASRGCFKCIQYLLPYIDDDKINSRNQGGHNALHISCFNGFEKCVNALLQHDHIDVHTLDGSRRTAIHSAANENKWGCIQILADEGVDASVMSLTGFTALHVAAKTNSKDCIAELLPIMSADSINAINGNGNTALHEAVKNTRMNMQCIVGLLKSVHIDVNAKDLKDNTALEIVEKRDKGKNIIKRLISGRANIDAKNDEIFLFFTNDPLNENYEFIQYLLQHSDID